MSNQAHAPVKNNRDAKIDVRCSVDLKSRLERIAAVRECDLSDLVRDALRAHVMRFEQQSFAA